MPNQARKATPAQRGSAFYNILDYGAVADGATLCTRAFADAIEAAAAKGGGTIFVPAGRFLTGAIFFKSNITLHIDAGATILGSQRWEDYPLIDSRWEGQEQLCHAPLITGTGLENIAVVGRGTIDGQGKAWWDRFWAKTLKHPRPRLIAFHDSKNILIEGITVRNSPAWTINPVCCENVTVHGISLFNPEEGPNTDGINPDSCCGVRISDCYIDAGDDCITIKSGIEASTRIPRVPCQDISITNCTMIHGHGGVVIGSEMSGSVRNVVVSNCVFHGTERGIRIKSRRGRGGVVEDIRVSNIIMQDVQCPFVFNLFYYVPEEGADTPVPADETTPQFRRIHMANITARDAHFAAATINGLPEMPIESVTFENVTISMSATAQAGWTANRGSDSSATKAAGMLCSHVRDLRLSKVRIEAQNGVAFSLDNVAEADLLDLENTTPAADQPVIQMTNCRDVYVRGCKAAKGTGTYLAVAGKGTQHIELADNRLSAAAKAVNLASDVPARAVQ